MFDKANVIPAFLKYITIEFLCTLARFPIALSVHWKHLSMRNLGEILVFAFPFHTSSCLVHSTMIDHFGKTHLTDRLASPTTLDREASFAWLTLGPASCETIWDRQHLAVRSRSASPSCRRRHTHRDRSHQSPSSKWSARIESAIRTKLPYLNSDFRGDPFQEC